MMKNKSWYLSMVIVAGVFQSCSVTKNYKEADIQLDQLNVTYFNTADSAKAEPIAFETYFTDLVLIDLIQKVLANNNDLIVATENLNANAALLKATKLNYLPDVNLQLNPSVQRLSKNSMMGEFAGSMTYQDYTIAPNLSWEIDLWGKLKGERKEAQALFLAQSENIRAIKLQLITQTASTYYNLLFLNNQLTEIKSMKGFSENSVELIEKQYNYGDATTIAVKQAKDQVFDLEKTIAEINQSISNQEVALSTLLGKYPTEFSFEQSITDVQFKAYKEDRITVTQLQNRPDVKRAELELSAANARVGINNAALYPSLVISAQGGLNSITAGNIFNVPASLFGNLAGGITQPLFNKRRLKSNLEQALHLRDAKIASFKQEVIKSVAEVTDAINNLNYLEAQKEITSNKMNNLVHTISDAQKLYQYGEITYLEVLAIQQIYIQANIALLEMNRKTIDAHIHLYKAIGG